jgi:hypothetical protein
LPISCESKRNGRKPVTRLAIILAAATGLTAGAPAAAAAPEYRAELARPAAASTFVVRDLIWRCAGADCVAVATGDRPAIDCAALAGRAGALRGFSLAGQALPADQLEKCNARAH